MKISFITTIYNEERTIEKFLESILEQTKLPDEIIIVDGGSTDNTVKIIKKQELRSKGVTIKLFVKRGNRSIGRNEAIKYSTGDILVCSDSGNLLDRNWVKKITEPFISSKVDVVAGYYKGITKNVFQKCLLPYVFVMPDKVDPATFLPATRSVAFTKRIWEKVGGFDEKLSHNEDYVFAKKLQKAKARIVFKKDAIVYWLPRNSFKEAFIMFWRFAYGDAEAKIFRPKVALLIIRYFLGILLLLVAFLFHSVLLFAICYSLFALYILWSIQKNYRYVHHWQSAYYLPLLQFIADAAVLSGTLIGIIATWGIRKQQ